MRDEHELPRPSRAKSSSPAPVASSEGSCATRCWRSGADVVSLVRAASPASQRGRSVSIDYADLAGLRRAVADERPDYVFHVAGATKGVTYEDFRAGNVMPT